MQIQRLQMLITRKRTNSTRTAIVIHRIQHSPLIEHTDKISINMTRAREY